MNNDLKKAKRIMRALKSKEYRQKEKERKEAEMLAKSVPTNIDPKYNDAEKAVIIQINQWVMSADGTAEGWGGYDFKPNDYTEISEEIFEITRQHFQSNV